MSGMRGEPRRGRCKIAVCMTFGDTGRKITTNIFLPRRHSVNDITTKLDYKFGKMDYIIHKLWMAVDGGFND